MPGKVRVSALARELGITSKDALARLAELGESAKSAVSTLDPDAADRLRAAVSGAGSPGPDDTAAVETPVATEPVEVEPAAPVAAEPETAAAPAAPAKKAARKRAAKKTAPAAADGPAAESPEAVDSAEAAAPPAKKASRKRAAKKTATPPSDEATTSAEDAGPDVNPAAAPAAGVLFMAPSDEPAPATSQPDADADSDADADTGSDPDEVREAAIDQANGARRRRRRGRRGRGGGGNGDTETTDESDDASGSGGADTSADSAADTAADTAGDSSDESEDGSDESGDQQQGTSSSSRRRRRRRRSGSGGDSGSGNDDDSSDEGDDPPNTVTHVRDTKKKSGGGRGSGGGGNSNNSGNSDDDGVRGVKGSTRLEAKRQRRRDGRDTSRRRAPILTEAEFLARREAVDRVMAVRQNSGRTQIAVLEDDVLVEHYVTQASATSYVGNVYLGRVQNVLPSMEAAFIDIGKGRNGVLYAGEVNWDAAGLEGKSRAIEQALKSGDSVLVQVTKDPIGHKGARLTSQISLPGRFLVYVPGGGMTGISRRLPDTERHRLKSILKKIVPEDAGVIVRTAAEGASEEDLTRDVERLQQQWETIKGKADQKKNAPVLLHGEPDLAIRVVRDVFNEDFDSLIVQGDDVWSTVSEYIDGVAPDLAERVKRHTLDTDLFHDLRVDEQLMKALDRKVWLPSGGSLVIDRTEAMTVVDVNTGKFVGSGGNLEQTVTRNNLEAAEEIVRQLRLRDVGGIVVIDFIDMVLESNRDLVLRRLTECLGRDRTKHQVAEVTSLGLVQMTRKRVGEGLLEAFSEPCEVCKGRGVIIHADPVDLPSGSSSDSSDDDRPKNGKRRRGRGNGGNGANGSGSNANGNGSEAGGDPVEAPPAVDDEQRRAAAAAIAAIHRAAGSGDDDAAGPGADVDAKVTELASDLVAAVQRVEEPAAVPSESPSAGSSEGPSDAAEPAAEATPVAHTPVPEPEPVVETAPEPPAPANGTNGSGGRRRRRSASRPAGPPVPTT